MPRGKRTLSTEQAEALRQVQTADDEYQRARKYAHQEAQRRADEQIQTYATARDRAIYEAVQLGIPKAVVGRDGLGVKNPYTVLDAIDRAEGFVVEAVEEEHEGAPKTRFRWGDVLAIDAHALYGFVIDDTMHGVRSVTPFNPDTFHDGVYVFIDRVNETTMLKVGTGDLLNEADGGYRELRDWALKNAHAATPTRG